MQTIDSLASAVREIEQIVGQAKEVNPRYPLKYLTLFLELFGKLSSMKDDISRLRELAQAEKAKRAIGR